RVEIDVARCTGSQEHDRAQRRGPRQGRLIQDRVAVKDDASVGEQGRKLGGGWVAFVHDQRVRHVQFIERAAHYPRAIDIDDRHRRAGKRRGLRRLFTHKSWRARAALRSYCTGPVSAQSWFNPGSIVAQPGSILADNAQWGVATLFGGRGAIGLPSDRWPALDHGQRLLGKELEP